MSAATSSNIVLPILQELPPVEVRPARQPFHVLAKPTGAICNIKCEYCFYLEKEHMYEKGERFYMPLETAEQFVRQYIQAQPAGTAEINFAWQGGEPTLRGIDFFCKVVEFEKKYARPGLRVTNAFQTNGTLLDDDWGEFLHENDFLVGVSIDGPEHLHNRYRLDGKGNGTFKEVMRGIEVLQKHQVEYNTLTVVQESNSQHPREVYDFLESIGSTFFQFIPIVEVLGQDKVTNRSVDSDQFGNFLNGIFDRWIQQEDIGRIYVQHFDLMLGLVMGYPSSLCVHSETCGRAVAIEHNGDLFSCDHFVHWEDHLGNVNRDSLTEMLDGEKQTLFGNNKRDLLPKFCRECEYLKYCYGGCPAGRCATTPDGEPGLQYLCSGYKRFYAHTVPYFLAMGECLRRRRPASEFRQFMPGARQAASRSKPEAHGPGKASRLQRRSGPRQKVDRNAPCPCGSGRKFKKCCGV